MALIQINPGQAPNDGQGDNLRNSVIIINQNIEQIQLLLNDKSNIGHTHSIADINGLQPLLTTINTNLDSLNLTVSGLTASVDGLNSDVETLYANVNTLSESILSLNTSVSDQNTAISTINTTIDYILDQLETLITEDITEAPMDGQQYARQDGEWTVVEATGGTPSLQQVVDVNEVADKIKVGTVGSDFTSTTNSNVDDMAIDSDGKVYLAGGFTQYNGESVYNLIRINSDGSRDISFNQTFFQGGFTTKPGFIELIENGTKLFASKGYNGSANLDNDGKRWVASIFNLDGTSVINIKDSTIQSMQQAVYKDGKIYAIISLPGTNPSVVRRYNIDGTIDTTFASNTLDESNGYSLYVTDDSVYVGTYRVIFKLNLDGTIDTSFTFLNSSYSQMSGIYAITYYDGGIWFLCQTNVPSTVARLMKIDENTGQMLNQISFNNPYEAIYYIQRLVFKDGFLYYTNEGGDSSSRVLTRFILPSLNLDFGFGESNGFTPYTYGIAYGDEFIYRYGSTQGPYGMQQMDAVTGKVISNSYLSVIDGVAKYINTKTSTSLEADEIVTKKNQTISTDAPSDGKYYSRWYGTWQQTPPAVFATKGQGWGISTENADHLTVGSKSIDLSVSAQSGFPTGAGGSFAFAGGVNSQAKGNFSVSFGANNQALGDGSVVFGTQNIASGYYSLCVGLESIASGDFTQVSGRGNVASGYYSVASGIYNTASSFAETSIGSYGTVVTGNPTSFSLIDRIFNIGCGNLPTSRRDALTILKNGLARLPSVTNALITADATGKAIVTKEYLNSVIASVGSELLKVTENSKIGWRINKPAANYGDIGSDAIDLSVNNSASTTNGATGDFSFCSGTGNISSGEASFVAGGNNNWATGLRAFASGQNARANGYASHVSGISNIANGYYSIAGGQGNTAASLAEVSLGLFGTIATGSTTTRVLTDRILNIGCGAATGTRADALTILKNGLVTLPSMTNALITADSTGKSVVTKEYLNSRVSIKEIKIVSVVNYTLLDTDKDVILQFTSSTNVVVTVPAGLTANIRFEGKQMGTGLVTFVGASGVTVRTAVSEVLSTAERYSVFALDATGTDEYLLYGKLMLL